MAGGGAPRTQQAKLKVMKKPPSHSLEIGHKANAEALTQESLLNLVRTTVCGI